MQSIGCLHYKLSTVARIKASSCQCWPMVGQQRQATLASARIMHSWDSHSPLYIGILMEVSLQMNQSSSLYFVLIIVSYDNNIMSHFISLRFNLPYFSFENDVFRWTWRLVLEHQFIYYIVLCIKTLFGLHLFLRVCICVYSIYCICMCLHPSRFHQVWCGRTSGITYHWGRCTSMVRLVYCFGKCHPRHSCQFVAS